MRTMKVLVIALLLAAVTVPLGACSQARCAWQNACTTYKKSCEPLPGPPAIVDPVYDVDCGRGQEPAGRGAFAVPRSGS